MTSKERAALRAQANTIDTTLMVGKGGVSETLVAEAEKLLDIHELVKGRVLETAMMTPREVCDALCEATGAEGIQVVGSKFVIWRKSEKVEQEKKKAEKKLYGRRAQNLLKTDIKEKPEGYELIVDVPGFKKDEVKVALKDGYLTVSAAKGLDEDDEDKKGHYIRRERYAGACERSFYVGEEVTQEDIKGEYKHGILKLFVPKKEAKPVSNDPKYITIE